MVKGGETAFQRVALNEAISHLDQGLDLNNKLPGGSERDGQELEFRNMLGMTWMMARGWTDINVLTNLEPAFVLARSLQQPKAILLTRTGLWLRLQTTGHMAEALEFATETLAEAETTKDDLLRIGGHVSLMVTHFWLGNFHAAREQEQHLRAVYRDDQHAWIVNIMQHDMPSTWGLFSSHWMWMLGYPDQAEKLSDEKDEVSRKVRHPFNLGFSLGFGSWVFNYRREPHKLLQRAAECEAVAQESGLAFLSATQVLFTNALAAVDNNQHSMGVNLFDTYFVSPLCLPVARPYLLSVHAKALGALGRYPEALASIAQAIEQIERPGWNERSHYAEILRIKGWILQQQGDYQDAEFNLRASIDFARKQQAKSWELRTSTTLAEILAERGERRQAIELLKPVYDWFTEGFDTYDLKQAKKLLDEIA